MSGQGAGVAHVTQDNTPRAALVPAPAGSASFMVPTNFAEAKELAEYLAPSQMVPKELRGSPADVLIAMQMGIDIGLPPMQALQNIAVINGKPCMYGDAVLAVVFSRSTFEWIKEALNAEQTAARCIVKRRGLDEIERRFTMDDAKRAGLLDKAGPWKQYPARMLQMRARSWALRDAFPDALKGISIREEVQDYNVVASVGPGESVVTQVDALPFTKDDLILGAQKTEDVDELAAIQADAQSLEEADREDVLEAVALAFERLNVEG